MMSPTKLNRKELWPWIATLTILILAIFQLRYQGRVWTCACGSFFPWAGNVWSEHNSQHLFDPYSFSHVLHGLLFYGALVLALPKLGTSWRFFISVVLESGWEVVENSQFVIQRYREATASLGYQGDSVINSVGDILACAIGFYVARKLGLRWSVALFVVIELVMLVCIRDNLLLNVIMLIHPIEAIKVWQMAH